MMEMFLTVNEPLKGKTLMFKYPNLLTPTQIIDDVKLLRLLRGKVIVIDVKSSDDTVKAQNRKNYPKKNPSDYILKSMLLDDYKINTADFMGTNHVLAELIHKHSDWSVQQIVNKYYELTENMGTVDKCDSILGFPSTYLTTLVHSIKNPGFFVFEIEDKVLFGYKCHTCKEETQVDIEYAFRTDEPKYSNSRKVESFCVFMGVECSNAHIVERYKHALEFASKLLLQLEDTFSFLTNRYYCKVESQQMIGKYDEMDSQNKQLKAIEVIYSNYIKKMKTDDLANLMTQLCLCFINEYEFEFRGMKVNVHDLMSYKPLRQKFMDDHIVYDSEKTLLIYDKQQLIKKCTNARFREIIKIITPFTDMKTVQRSLGYLSDEVKFYASHLLYCGKARLIDPIDDHSVLTPSHDYQKLKTAFETKNHEFFRKFNRNLCDIMVLFFEKEKISYLECKKIFLQDKISPAEMIIELLYEDLISVVNTRYDMTPTLRKLSGAMPLLMMKDIRTYSKRED